MGRRNALAGVLAVAGGVLLLTNYALAPSRWSAMEQRVAQLLGESGAAQVAFGIILAIAALGGIGAIAGGLLLALNRVLLGKVVILFAVGFGLVGFALFLWANLRAGAFVLAGGSLLLLLGIGLTVAARALAGPGPRARGIRRLTGD